MDDNNTVSLLVNGQSYSGWLSVAIQKTIEAIAHGFSISLTDNMENKR
jgi:prophage tail gpP-like protein